MNHEKLLELIRSEPEIWLWSAEINSEIDDLLPVLRAALDEEGRKTLDAAMLRGPGSKIGHQELSKEDQDRYIWMRLAPIYHARQSMSKSLEERCDELKERFPDLAPGQSQEDTVPQELWSPSITDEDGASALCESEPREVREMLQEEDWRSDKLQLWEGCVMRKPQTGLDLLDYMVQRDLVHQPVLVYTFRGMADHLDPTPDNISRLKSIARAIPATDWGTAIISYMRMVNRFSQLGESSPAYLEIDEVIELLMIGMGPAISHSFELGGDVLNRATNHPVAEAIEAVLHRSQGNQGLPEGVRNVLDELLSDEHGPHGCTPAKVYLAFKCRSARN